ncbi:peptide-methionine (S)-S-oxide reductase [Lewinellaceae bacterium SD302]|nr:peptide-methionine (S)-S-oxide reductase [Lewinellaceae bacterium SD302]
MSKNPNVANAIVHVNNTDREEVAIIGGGCFWCIEPIYSDLIGVEASISGYAGGKAETADYESVCSKTTKHVEVILIRFDPQVVSYEEILQIFFSVHDPTTPNRQGNDSGPQYRSAIFYTDERQKEIAEKVIKDFAPSLHDDPIVTELLPFSPFYPAEDYHQDYFNKVGDRNPYCNFVIKPKVSKFRKSFAGRLKSNQT